MGGVLGPRIRDIVQSLNPEISLDLVNLTQLEMGFSLGQLPEDKLFLAFGELAQNVHVGKDHPPTIMLNTSMQPVLELLAKEFELVLFLDYPNAWGNPLLQDKSFFQYFQQIVPVDFAGTNESYDMLFDNLISEGFMEQGNSVLVDWNPLRTKAALNAGLDAAIFEDTNRFYRDLGLWGIVPLLDLGTIQKTGWRKA